MRSEISEISVWTEITERIDGVARPHRAAQERAGLVDVRSVIPDPVGSSEGLPGPFSGTSPGIPQGRRASVPASGSRPPGDAGRATHGRRSHGTFTRREGSAPNGLRTGKNSERAKSLNINML